MSAETGVDVELKSRIAANLARVRERIEKAAARSGRDAGSVKLLAVTKTFGPAHVRAAVEAGHLLFGENKMQEALEKIPAVPSREAEWHFIGHLQRNKAKPAIEHFELIESLDRVKLARHLDRLAGEAGRRARVFAQLDLAGEETKSGFSVEEFLQALDEIVRLENLSVEGLMTIPPFFDDPERARPFFAELREIRERIALPEIKELSMGMTGDFEVAVEEGATIVRLGTAIFGARG